MCSHDLDPAGPHGAAPFAALMGHQLHAKTDAKVRRAATHDPLGHGIVETLFAQIRHRIAIAANARQDHAIGVRQIAEIVLTGTDFKSWE